ncbi:MAG TPA: hypothetical protein VKA98_06365 [Nitrososphaeraceae archaeon]|nr:hypothetical protein [Nitrososphaeraceae archaeon]
MRTAAFIAHIDVPAMMSKVGFFFLPSFLSFSESHSYSALYAPTSYAPRDPPPCYTKALSFAGIFVIILFVFAKQKVTDNNTTTTPSTATVEGQRQEESTSTMTATSDNNNTLALLPSWNEGNAKEKIINFVKM